LEEKKGSSRYTGRKENVHKRGNANDKERTPETPRILVKKGKKRSLFPEYANAFERKGFSNFLLGKKGGKETR